MAERAPRLSYWVIVPEVGTGVVVEALRRSWLSMVRPKRVFYCVANNSASQV